MRRQDKRQGRRRARRASRQFVSEISLGRPPVGQIVTSTYLSGSRPHDDRLPELVSQRAAVRNLGGAFHPVVFRLALRAGIDLGGQRDRSRGEDQGCEESLGEHGMSWL